MYVQLYTEYNFTWSITFFKSLPSIQGHGIYIHTYNKTFWGLCSSPDDNWHRKLSYLPSPKTEQLHLEYLLNSAWVLHGRLFF